MLLILEPETAHAEQVAYKQYNNCRVITNRDEFTDKDTTLLMCDGSGIGLDTWDEIDLKTGKLTGSSPGYYGIAIISDGTGWSLVLRTGLQFHADGLIKVRYRFGKTQHKEETWAWLTEPAAADSSVGQGYAVTLSKKKSQTFLKNMTSTEHIVFQIGQNINRGFVKFTDQTKSAVADFRKRLDGHYPDDE